MANPTLFHHTKLRHLTRLLKDAGVGPYPRLVAIGLLESLWHQSYTTPSAYLGCADDVEDAAGWNGERGVLAAALVESGFLDEAYGAHTIHDWQDHLPDFARRPRPPTILSEAWDAIAFRLRVAMGREDWQTWFAPLRVQEEREGVLLVQAPNEHFVDALTRSERLKALLVAAAGDTSIQLTNGSGETVEVRP